MKVPSLIRFLANKAQDVEKVQKLPFIFVLEKQKYYNKQKWHKHLICIKSKCHLF